MSEVGDTKENRRIKTDIKKLISKHICSIVSVLSDVQKSSRETLLEASEIQMCHPLTPFIYLGSLESHSLNYSKVEKKESPWN